MRKSTATVINLGLALLEKTKGEDVRDYFCTDKIKKSGHYTEKGNRILAENDFTRISSPITVTSPTRVSSQTSYTKSNHNLRCL
jgi:hypothetical protein